MKLLSPFFIFACTIANSANCQQPKFVIKKASYTFKLDSKQTSDSRFIVFDEEARELLRSVEFPNKNIEIFDVSTGLIKNKISPPLSAIDIIKKTAQGTILAHDSWEQEYLIINYKGKVLKTLAESKSKNEKPINILTGGSSFTPISTYKNCLYITGTIQLPLKTDCSTDVFQNAGIVTKIDASGKVSYIGQQATAYLNGYYGTLNRYTSTLNGDNLIVSPMVGNELLIVNLNSEKTTRIKIKNKYSDGFKPLSLNEDRAKISKAIDNQNFFNSNSYIGIVYDKYRNVYYRFLRKPTQSAFSKIEGVILVLDNNFNQLLEFTLPNYSEIGKFFITKSGICFLNTNVYKENGNLSFDQFTFVK